MTEAKTERPEGAAAAKGQHGVAILMVVACLAVLLPFTTSFSYNSRVDFQSAINQRDEVVARNLERGAMRLSLLLFELQRQVFSQKQFRQMVGAMDITQIAPYLMSIFGSKDGAEELGAFASLMGLDGFDTSIFGDLGVEYGTFEVRLDAESGKVNVNCLGSEGDGANNPKARVAETLEAMLLPTLYNPLFEEEKSDGQRYTREQVLAAIVDYIDEDTKRFDMVKLTSGSANESYRYTQLYDPYEPRNARLDTIEELHLVEGVDDDLMLAFGDTLTVYGDAANCKVNINFASADQLALVLRHAVAEEDRWRTEGENFLLKTMPLARYVVEYRQMTLFKDVKDFVEFVKKPDQFISPLAMLGASGSGSGGGRNPNMPRIPEGMSIRVEGGKDKKSGDTWGGVKDVAGVDPERIYRVEVITEVGAVKRRLNAVYDMQYARSQTKGKGAWLYYRED